MMAVQTNIFLLPQDLIERWRGCVKLQTLAKWRALRKGPRYSRMGGRVLYSLEDIEAFEAASQKA